MGDRPSPMMGATPRHEETVSSCLPLCTLTMNRFRTGKHWFVPLRDLLKATGATLQPADSMQIHDSQWVESGSPFTISLESFCVAESFDSSSHNDLLVRSWTQYGDDPPVEIVHCFEREIEPGKAVENLAIEHMFATQHYDDEKTLTLYIQILEVDGDRHLGDEIITVAHLLGAVFPTILPLTSAASGLYKSLKHLFSKKEKTVSVFEGSLQLYSNRSSAREFGPVPFRCGAYVLFNHDVEGSRYRLRDLKVDSPDLPQTYGVIKIIPKVVNSYNSEDLLVNQRLATGLLTTDPDDEFAVPLPIQKLRRHMESLSYIRGEIQKAKLLDELNEYRTLRRLQTLTPDASDSPKDRLERAERLQAIKSHLARDPAFQKLAASLKQRSNGASRRP